jgi:hypothetical protein
MGVYVFSRFGSWTDCQVYFPISETNRNCRISMNLPQLVEKV